MLGYHCSSLCPTHTTAPFHLRVRGNTISCRKMITVYIAEQYCVSILKNPEWELNGILDKRVGLQTTVMKEKRGAWAPDVQRSSNGFPRSIPRGMMQGIGSFKR